MVGTKRSSVLSTRLAIFLVSIPIVLAAVQLFFLAVGEDTRGLVADVGSPLFASTAAALSFVLYWYNRRTPFRDIGLGFTIVYICLAIAETIFAVYVEVFGIEPGVSVADAFWIAGYLGLVVLFAKMVRDSESRPSKRLLSLEVVYWALMLPFLGYVTYQSFLPEDADVLNMITMAIYVWGDAVILSLLIVLLVSDVISELQEFRTFISVATIFIMGGDILYTVYETTVGYSVGSPPDVFFVSGYLLLAFGFALLVRARMRLLSIAQETEIGLGTKSGRRLLPTTTHIVMGERLHHAYDMLLTEIEAGRKGIIVTRKDPESLRKDHNLRGTPILLLSTSPGNNVIHPANLGILTDTLTRAMEGEAESIILIDGIESLIAYNDFQKVLRMIDHLKDEASVNRASLIVVVDDGGLSDKEKVLMTKGADLVLT